MAQTGRALSQADDTGARTRQTGETGVSGSNHHMVEVGHLLAIIGPDGCRRAGACRS
jgi:hypothetical protein